MLEDMKLILENQKIQEVNKEAYDKVKKNWDSIAKPIDSMGKFEHYLSKVGAIQDTLYPCVCKSAILVFAGDNGIVEENISQSDQSITAICANNIAKGLTSVCVMANANQIEVKAIDVGVNAQLDKDGPIPAKVRMGTRNFLKEPAMTEEETLSAMKVGYLLAKEHKDKGYSILGVGEIGIGNTTTSSAIACALLKCESKLVTGRGAGLSDDRLAHKIEVVQQAVDKYGLYEASPLEILETVGGFDIAAMVGLYIGAAVHKIPVVLDGFISMVAALVAERLLEGVKEYLIPSHMSKEPACQMLAKELELDPVIDANMALGEGTGAVLMISLLKTANEVYRNTCLFDQVGIEQYVRY